MIANYLKRYYLEDKKLAQRALLEFGRALRTGRMIAFTGAMATQAFGYGSWHQLRLTFAALALEAARRSVAQAKKDQPWDTTLDRQREEAIKRILKLEARARDRDLNGQVAMSLIEEALDNSSLLHRAPCGDWPNESPFLEPVSGQSRTWPLDQFTTPPDG